jgi:hypothetical protein
MCPALAAPGGCLLQRHPASVQQQRKFGSNFMTSRRAAIGLIGIGLAALIASAGGAAALDYPTRPVRFVVGYPPGGATDILARLIGQRLSEKLGQQFVVENKPGAGNNIGTEAVVNAEPDGYTVLLINPANYINTSLYANLKFNFVRDIAAVASFTRVPNVMTVNKDVAAKNVAEFIAYVKANPGKVNMASSGNGTSVHLSGEMFMAMTGAKMQHVPYRGGGAGDHRYARRPGAGHLRQHALDHSAYPWRCLARLGGDDGRAVAAIARCANSCRNRAGL